MSRDPAQSDAGLSTAGLSGVIQLLDGFLRERQLAPGCCFLHGSAVFGQRNEKSDVDVFLVFARAIRPFREKAISGGVLLDIFAYDAETLYGALFTSRTNGNLALARSIANASPWPSNELARQIQEGARQAVAAGPIIENRAEVRQHITGLVDDLAVPLRPEDLVMTCVCLYQTIVYSELLFRGYGGFTKKDATRALHSFDPELTTRLTDSLAEAVQGNTQWLAREAVSFLAKIGGELRAPYFASLAPGLRLPLPAQAKGCLQDPGLIGTA